MLNIAVCDDNNAELSNLLAIINDYKALHKGNHLIEATAYHNALDLITAMERGQPFDLVLLDILMPCMTGMEAAKEIRQFNQDVKIVFTSASPEFAVESYSVSAYYYVLKPIRRELLFNLLGKVISEAEARKGLSLLVKSKEGLIRLYVSRLEFAEVIGRTIYFHLTDGSVIEADGAMSGLEKELLIHPFFKKPHRSYIINVHHIDTLGQREIKMQSLAIVPVAKANFRSVKASYIACAFEELNTLNGGKL